jgi:DNA-binding response OmpR family regulator
MEEIAFLIVEDDTSQALFLESLLHESGYDKVRICQSGQEAILIVKNYSIDVVLMDIQLKGDLDGIQTAIEIDKIDLCKIIYITSLKDKRTFDRAKQTFPESFLS